MVGGPLRRVYTVKGLVHIVQDGGWVSSSVWSGKGFDFQTVQTVTSYTSIPTTPSRPPNGSLRAAKWKFTFDNFSKMYSYQLISLYFHYYNVCFLKIKVNTVSHYQWPNHYISVLTHILIFSYILFWQNMLCNCQDVLTNSSRKGRPVHIKLHCVSVPFVNVVTKLFAVISFS